MVDKRELIEKRIQTIPECGCWIWIGATNKDGYGNLRFNKKYYRAHRFSWWAFIGEIPDGMCVLHKCDTPACVNPKHLFVGNQKDNIRDAVNKNRIKLPAIARGEKNPSAKLKIWQIEKILNSSDSQVVIANKYGVAQSTISQIKRGLSWR